MIAHCLSKEEFGTNLLYHDVSFMHKKGLKIFFYENKSIIECIKENPSGIDGFNNLLI